MNLCLRGWGFFWNTV